MKQLLVELSGKNADLNEIYMVFLEKNCRLLGEYSSEGYHGYVLECRGNTLLHMFYVEAEDLVLIDIYGSMDSLVELLKYLGEKIGANRLGIHVIERLV